MKPDSAEDALRLLAKAEDFFGDFKSAFERITRSIDLANADSNQSNVMANNRDMDQS